MKVFLDGIPVQYPNTSLLKPTYTFRRSNENREPSIGFTGELSFTGTDYDYIYGKLVTDPNAINNFIILTLEDDCCPDAAGVGIILKWQIKPESCRWCEGECEISVTALEYSDDAEAYRCVNNTLIYDDWNGFQSRPHPRVPYCLELRPSILQDLMLIFGVATVSMSAVLYPFLLVFQTILNTINFIISAVNTLPGVSIDEVTFGTDGGNMSILNWAQDLSNTISAFVVGCNYNHPSPFVRDYIKNVCDKCGLAFQSSILNNPSNDYWLLVYFSAQIRKGQSAGDYFGGLANYIQRNKPIYNGKRYFDEVVQPFNAEWDISQNTLRLERRDYFHTITPWFDITTYDPDKVISECYEWTKNPRNALAEIGYSKDGMDWVGDEAVDRWSDVVEWNSPPSPLQKGEFIRSFPFGAARFREDGLDRDVLSDYTWLPFGMGAAITANNNVLLMNNGMAFLPKMLILEPGYDWQHALIRRTDSVAGLAYGEGYNYPMWVDATMPNNLYDRFWSIENPRNALFAGKDVELVIEYNCDVKRAIDIDGTVRVTRGIAHDLTVEVTESNNTMTIKGTL